MAAIFDFNGNGKLGRKRNLYQGGGRRSNMRRGVGVGGVKIMPAQKVIVILQNSVCPLADFLIGEVKLQLSITSQMCQYYQYPYYNIIRKKFLKRKILT